MKHELVCYCGKTVEYDTPERIDVAQEPETVDKIIDGSFMTLVCDSCGAELKPEVSVLFEAVSTPFGRLSIEYMPELDRTKYYAGKRESSADRLAIGFPELREKFLIFSHEMDDRAVEILKFLLREKAENSENLKILLGEIRENEIHFYLYGLKEEEVGISKVPISLYQKVVASLDERLQSEVYAQICEPPYVSINKILIEEDDS